MVMVQEEAEECASAFGADAEQCGKTSSMRGLMRARTCAFVCVVFCENIRAYTSRSFNRPVLEGMFANVAMQKAVAMAEVAMILVIFIPGLSDTIMQLEGINLVWEGWVLAVIGAICCMTFCEMYKVISGVQMEAYQ